MYIEQHLVDEREDDIETYRIGRSDEEKE